MAKPLKCLHSEQLSRVQAKNQQECDLLEDIRNFTKQRAAIEKTYAEALLKVSSTYIHRKLPQLPEIPSDGETTHYNVFTVWKTLLDETEKLAKARLAASEMFQQRIVEDAKIVRTSKVQTSKKCLEQLQVIQKELQGCVQELDICKKRYMEEEHVAHDARDRASQAEEKLKKKKGFFTSFSSLQRNSSKLTAKREQFEEKSTSSRNAYLLQLSATKCHQERYFSVDLQNLLRTMEGDTFEKVAEYLLLIGRTELFSCSASQASFTKLRDQAACIDPAYNIECYTALYPAIAQNVSFEYEPCEGDKVRQVVSDNNSRAELDVEAQLWVSHSTKESRNLRSCQKRLTTLVDLKQRGERTDPHDPSGTDIDIRIDEMRNNIRLSETAIVKCQARIQLLKDGGVNVDELMKQMNAGNLSVDEGMCGSNSQSNMHEQQYHDTDSDANDTSSPVPAAVNSSFETEKHPSYDDDEDAEADKEVRAVHSRAEDCSWGAGSLSVSGGWGDVPTTPVPPAPQLPGVESVWSPVSWDNVPCSTTVATASLNDTHEDAAIPPCVQASAYPPGSQCYAIYSYEAQNADELTITENEVLVIISDGDDDGWLKAANQAGDQGMVPHNYIELIVDADETSGGAPHETGTQESIDSVEVVVNDESSLARTLSLSADSTGTTAAEATVVTDDIYCRALYDYDATCDEELTLCEDDVVHVLRMTSEGAGDDDEVDDGWWYGQRITDEMCGLFPSLVVEQCHASGDPLTPESEGSASVAFPPGITPPQAPDHASPDDNTATTRLVAADSVEEQPDSALVSDVIEEPMEPKEEAEASGPAVVIMECSGAEDSKQEASAAGDIQQKPTIGGLDFASIVVTAPTPSAEQAPDICIDSISDGDTEPDSSLEEHHKEDAVESSPAGVAGEEGEPFPEDLPCDDARPMVASECQILHTPATPPEMSDESETEPLPPPPPQQQQQQKPDTPAEQTDTTDIGEQFPQPPTPQEASVLCQHHDVSASAEEAGDITEEVKAEEDAEDDDHDHPEELEPIHLVKLENMQESEA